MRTPFAILTDTTLCTGCEKCVEACRSENNLPEDVPRRWKSRIDDLSSTRYTTIVRRPDEEKPGSRFVRQQCRHCADPACVSACLVGALQKTPEGPVIYDSDRCMGCRYCMMSCPYGIPRYTWEDPVPYIRKCDMCYDRVTEGGRPACVEACPERATIFGQRDALIDEAHHRIQDNAGKYIDKVFGETEIGGTSVIYISDIPLDFLAFKPELGNEPLPKLTWAALSKVPPLVVGVGAGMTGIWWIVGRRMKLAEEAARSRVLAEEIKQGPSAPEPSSEEHEQ
jgi:formate dehydrogenase iron-sulfur subunit